MPSGLHTWSQTSGSNATADSAINWAEGQAPSSVNDSARAEMAVIAKWRDDNNGSLTTGGTSTAYTLATNTVFTSLALMDNQTLKFTMHATSGASPTLNVDGLGAKPIHSATTVSPGTGALVAASVYSATYDNSVGEWLLHDQLAVLPNNSVATASITDANVTYAKIQNVAASRLLGNPTGGAAAPSEITLGSGLSFSGTSLANSIIIEPQGYLTLTSSTPIIPSDVTAATAIYYTPFKGNQIPIYNGSSFILTAFAELTLGLVASHTASTLYDVFVINDSATIRLVTGPAWNVNTAGSCARGTGAGTTELQRVSGLWTNANSMTARYGSSTTSVAANQGTYVGSVFIDSSAGQTSCHRSYGQSRKWGVWNAYNRQQLYLKTGDSTASWTYAVATLRAANGSAANSMTVFSGLAEAPSGFRFFSNTTPSGALPRNGIGYNSTTVASGFLSLGASSPSSVCAEYTAPPALGINVVTALEYSNSGTTQFNGTEQNMLLSGSWMG